MIRIVKLYFGTLIRLFRGRRGPVLENLALRQQLAVLKRQRPARASASSIGSSG